jgi:hypothetical protein
MFYFVRAVGNTPARQMLLQLVVYIANALLFYQLFICLTPWIDGIIDLRLGAPWTPD